MKCELCERTGEEKYFEKHHLEPQNNKSETITVCHQCGDQIHLLFTNAQLKNELNTIEKIKSMPVMQTYLNWVNKKPIGRYFSVAEKKRRK